MPDQILQFAFTRGVDQKTDKHSRLPGGVDQVVNGVYDKLGAIQKRHGNVSQGNSCVAANPAPYPLVGPSTLPAGQAVGAFGFGAEQDLLVNNRLYSYSPSSSKHVSRDYFPEGVATRKPLLNLSSNASYVNPDCVLCNGYEVWAWQQGTGLTTIATAIYDAGTGTTIQPATLPATFLSSSRTMPKLCAPTATLVVLCYEDYSGNVYARTLDTTAIGAGWGAETRIGTGAVASSAAVYDLTATGDGKFVVATAMNAGGVLVARLDPLTYSGSNVTLGTDTGITAICVQGTTGETLYVAWGTASVSNVLVRVQGLDPTALTTTFAVINAITLALAMVTPLQVGLARISATNEVVVCNATANSNNSIPPGALQRITNHGALDGAQCGWFSLWLASRPFQFNGKTYALMWFPSAVQGTYFWCDLNSDFGALRQNGTDYWPRKVAASANRLANNTPAFNGSMRANGSLSNVMQPSAGVFRAPGSVVVGSGLVGQLRLWRMQLDFTAPGRARGGQLGRSYVFGNSVYDGQIVSELGFDVYPERISAGVGAGAGLSVGAYQYMLVYLWTTASGETIRSTGQPGSGSSPATQAVSVTTTMGNQQVVLANIPVLNVQAKSDGEANLATPVAVEIYRTQVNGSTFSLVTTLVQTSANGPVLDQMGAYTDTASDASILGSAHPFLYFTPGAAGTVLENVSPPSFTDTWLFKNRIFGIGDDLRTVWFSKQFVDGQQPGFNEGLTLTIQDGADLVAGDALDDKCILWTRYATYYVYGEGPDATGTVGAFSAPQRISGDVGCIDPRSILRVPDGLVFLSAKGLVLLTRALELVYLDGPEDLVRTYPVFTSAVLFPEYQEARWTCQNAAGTAGIILVCNYWQPDQPYKYRWSHFQLYDSVAALAQCVPAAAACVNGSYRWISGGGNPFTEDTAGTVQGAYMDGGGAGATLTAANWITLKVQTSWVETAGFAGYQRAKRIQPIGDFYTSHDLTVSAATEFDPGTTPPHGNAWTWKSDSVQGLLFERVMLAVQNQKATAIQVTIADAYPTGAGAIVGTGRGMSLSGIGLRVGTKEAMGKLLPAAQRG